VAVVVGLDVAEVRQLGNGLRQQSEALTHLMASIHGLVDQLSQHWQGHDAEEFRGWWEAKHRVALEQAIAAVAGLGQSALNNADEQDHASGTGGVGAATTGWSTDGWLRKMELSAAALGVGGLLADAASPARTVGRYTNTWSAAIRDFGPTLRYKQSPALQFLAHSPLKYVADSRVLSGIGTVGGIVGMGVTGVHLGEALASHDYVAAGFAGLDATSEVLKASGNPVAYGFGVDVAIWKDVGEAATAVDWSHLGDLRHATLSDWGDAFGESLKETAGKAVTWF